MTKEMIGSLELNRIYQRDCIEGMRMLPDESVDLVVTDPAYPCISGGRKKNAGQPSGILLKNDGKIFNYNEVDMKDWMTEVYRVLKTGSHFYTMTNVLNLQKMLNIGVELGFKLHNILIWKKNNVTPSQYYMKNAEYILFFRKGRAKYINNIGTKTVIELDNVRSREHPTQKPVELMRIFIENSSNKDGTVLDPFMGSGTTAVAAVCTNRKFIGFEREQEYVEIANKRLDNEEIPQ
ncbi:DNA-methyltransferase [Cytobacillus gottheilii]|uniref:Methyltransferase n=1 Tax=Cytobacillus gottheilii TaxID=859144 RepID=A0ABX8FG21_9BACI|nr:site-specific DNA-methyltransferase [Cytobacillus gottheilii]QVY62976.1 site-specific DNA-methyltransferase [Cytobacillus gottheilii]